MIELLGGMDVRGVLYADAVDLLVRLLENVRASILHSQMPSKLFREQLDSVKSSEWLFMTSVGEIGLELEEMGFHPRSMISVNTNSVMKVVQRLGRLARRKGSSGTFVNLDTPWARERTSLKFANGLSSHQDKLPSFLEMVEGLRPDFFTSYISPNADRAFFRILSCGEPSRVKIYVRPSLTVKCDGEDVSLPLMKASSKVIPVTSDRELVLDWSKIFNRLTCEVRERRGGGRPAPDVRVDLSGVRYDALLLGIPDWLKRIGVRNVMYSRRREISLKMPLLNGFSVKVSTPLLIFVFGRGLPRGYRAMEQYQALVEGLYPASQDMDFILPRGRSDVLVGFEVANDEIGAVEHAIQLMGGNLKFLRGNLSRPGRGRVGQVPGPCRGLAGPSADL